MGVHEDLVAARNLLDRSGWVQRKSHARVLVCDPLPRLGHAYCLWGAVREVAPTHEQQTAVDYLLFEMVGTVSIGFNDCVARSKRDVLDLLDEAIALTAPEPEGVELGAGVSAPEPKPEEIPIHA